jgi:hypothetical protein
MATPSAATRKKLQRKFRLRGFTLKVDALEEAAAFLARFPDAEDDALDLLLDELDKEPRNQSVSPLSLSALPVVSSPIWLSFGARARACSAVVDS